MKLCVNLNGHEFCMTIPQLIPLVPAKPDPEEPRPDPWLTGLGVTPEAAQGMRALATIAAAAEFLPVEQQEQVKAAVQGNMEAFVRKVPGATFRFPGYRGPTPDPGHDGH